MMTLIKKQIRKLSNGFFYVVFLSLIMLTQAYAAETGLPWEGPLEKILASLTGPVAKVLGVVAIVIAGFGIAFGEAGSGMRRLFQVILGLSIAFTATTLLVTLFGFTG
ncbi:MAG: TrbC/VirB2 family protein [Gammaproteobacteria bacterium]|nr:TrbC/VirB2 family protein [Gammaproteobacteria bacterium]